jgi:hypothetical protein
MCTGLPLPLYEVVGQHSFNFVFSRGHLTLVCDFGFAWFAVLSHLVCFELKNTLVASSLCRSMSPEPTCGVREALGYGTRWNYL